MNIQEIMAMQKLATKAYDLIKKYAPEDEEDWENDDDEDDFEDDDEYDA